MHPAMKKKEEISAIEIAFLNLWSTIFFIDLQTYTRKTLDSDKKIYEKLTWDEEGNVLAVLKGVKKCAQNNPTT